MPKLELPYDLTRGAAWQRRVCQICWAALAVTLAVTCIQFHCNLKAAVDAGKQADAAYLAA